MKNLIMKTDLYGVTKIELIQKHGFVHYYFSDGSLGRQEGGRDKVNCWLPHYYTWLRNKVTDCVSCWWIRVVKLELSFLIGEFKNKLFAIFELISPISLDLFTNFGELRLKLICGWERVKKHVKKN